MPRILALFIVLSILLLCQLPSAKGQIDLAIPSNAQVFKIGVDTANDFSTIATAMSFVDTAAINQPFVFLLTDSTYPNDPFPITFGPPQHMGLLGSVTFQPENGVHVVFENPAINNTWLFSFHASRNTRLYGRSPDSTGTITIIDHSPFNKRVISLSVTQTLSNVNTQICHLTVKATHPSNQLTGIFGRGEFTQRLLNTTIAFNHFEGLHTGIALSHSLFPYVTSPYIYKNCFGGDENSYSTAVYAIILSAVTNGSIEGNTIAYIQNLSSFVGILIYHSTGVMIIRNRFHHIRVGNAITGISTTLHSYVSAISNLMHSFGSIDPTLLSAQITGVTVGTGAMNLYHNTISFSDSGNHVLGEMRTMTPLLAGSFREVYNNVFELKSIHPTGSSYIYFAPTVLSARNSPLAPNNNVYLFPSGSDKGLARRMGPVTYFTFDEWRNELQSTGNVRESFTFAANNQQYRLLPDSLHNWVPDSLLAEQINGMGRNIPLLQGVLNEDLNGRNRPAFGGTLPDPGAVEFNANATRNLSLPLLVDFSDNLHQLNYQVQQRTLTLRLTDSVAGISKAEVRLYCDASEQLLPLQLDSGTAFHGLWKLQLPHQGPRGCYLHLYITDSTGNKAVYARQHAWEDAALAIKLGPDTIVTELDSIVLQSEGIIRYPLRITEYLADTLGWQGNWPAHLPTDLTHAVELTHFGNDTLDVSGLVLKAALSLSYLRSFVFPAGSVLYPRQSIVIGNSTAVSGNGFYKFIADTAGYRRMEAGHEFALYDPFNRLIDYLPINFSPLSTPNLWYSADSWQGDGVRLNNSSGASLQLWDINQSIVWQDHGQLSPSPGQNHLMHLKHDTLQWQWAGLPNPGKPFLLSAPLTAGIYPIYLHVLAGSQQTSDSMLLRVSGNGNSDFIAPQIVSFRYSDGFHNSCVSSGRFMEFVMQDTANGSGIEQVHLLLSTDASVLSFTPTLDTGTVMNGKYVISLPSLSRQGVYHPQLFAIDSAGNSSDTLNLPAFTGRQYEFAGLGTDTVVPYNALFVKGMGIKPAHRRSLQFTEYVFDFGLFGGQPTASLPPGLEGLNQNADLVKITNVGSDSVTTAGLYFHFYTSTAVNSHAVPAMILAPGQDMYLVFGGLSGSPSDAVFRLFGIPNLTHASSGGFLLVDSLSKEALSALAFNGFNFPPSLPLGAHVWGGAALQTGQSAGVYRTAASAVATSWQLAQALQNTRLGQTPAFQYQERFQWRINGQVIAVADSLYWTANRSAYLSVFDTSWSCGVLDSIRITVIGGDNPADLALNNVSFPNGLVMRSQAVPQITISNLTGESVSRVGIQVIWNGSLIGSDLIQQTLFPGDTLNYLLADPIDISDTLLGHTLCIKHLWPFDTVGGNDEYCVDVQQLASGVSDDLASAPIFVYPNPSSDLLYVRIPLANAADLQWYCFDYLGRVISLPPVLLRDATEWQLSVSDLKPGPYQLLVRSEKQIWHAKFQIMK